MSAIDADAQSKGEARQSSASAGMNAVSGPSSAGSSTNRNPFLTDEDLSSSMDAVRIGHPSGSGNNTGPSQSSSSTYPEPTTIPTPGRALLRDGNILIMPATWESCSKCHGTGYKHADPQQPHEACWRLYGRRYTSRLVDDLVDSPVILQKPLPSLSHWSTQVQQPQYPPPNHHPPPSLLPPRRDPREPPQVNRAQDANEANDDPDGEAPPAYEDVVRVPSGVSLPPQRTGVGGATQQQQQQQQQGGGNDSTSNNLQQAPTHASPPQPPRPPFGHSGYPGQGSYSHPHPYPHPHHGYPSSGHHHPPFVRPQWHTGPHAPFIIHNSSPIATMPPPGALVVSPGDPRIGGRVCTRCGGRGVRDSMWWGEETCHHCQGAGRVL